ncbi:MAG: hypothetical protein LBC51_12055 [Treponema sp.]|jgi:uncharacterized protein YihD (DUF1040 family)|nr:hypothetical protein [Treponema sp.]
MMKENTGFLKAAGKAAGLPALLLALGLVLAACPTEDDGGGYSPPSVDVQGTFPYKGENVEFYAEDNTPRSIIRAAASDGYTITGKLRYGSAVLTVEGTYIPGEKVFRASAVSGNISFEIEGELDDNYNLKSAKVRIVTKSSGRWNQAGASTANVTPADNVDIPEDAEPFPTEGVVPAEFRGKWVFKEMEDMLKQQLQESAAEEGYSVKFNQVTSFVIITPMAIQQNVVVSVTVSSQGQSQDYEEEVDRTLDLVLVTQVDGVTTATVQFEGGTERPYTMEISGNTLTMASPQETVHFVR